jgi:hypothetical protein
MNANAYGVVRPDALDKLRTTAEQIVRNHDVRPFYEDDAKTVPKREQSLFDLYATEEEVAAVRAAHARIATAQAQVSTVRSALVAVSEQMKTAQRAGAVDADRAAAVALGEPIEALQTYSGPSLSQLQAQRTGLERRIQGAELNVSECRGKFRAAVFELVRTCAFRCADDYDKATRTQAWCHQQLHIAQQLTGSSTHRLVDDAIWSTYSVPGSEHIPVLKRNSRDEWGRPVRMSADRLTLSGPAALKALRAHGEELFSNWPLG